METVSTVDTVGYQRMTPTKISILRELSKTHLSTTLPFASIILKDTDSKNLRE